MCSIMVDTGSGISERQFADSFSKTISRGPDDTRIIRKGSGIMGFHRLSIMGLTPEGMQPFLLDDDAIVCNGEIYGFMKLKKQLEKKYSFKSDSDCEILLPLWREYGTDMFKMLDSEFALVLYDSASSSFVAARDPIGLRPLYFGYGENDKIIFASEPKNLVGLCDTILPFPPGHFYYKGEFVPYSTIYHAPSYSHDDLEKACSEIRDKLIKGVEKRLVSDSKVGFLLSGGLDSSLVCAIAQKMSNKPIKTFAIGMDKDAIDLKYAKETAEYIGSDHTEVIINKDIVLSS